MCSSSVSLTALSSLFTFFLSNMKEVPQRKHNNSYQNKWRKTSLKKRWRKTAYVMRIAKGRKTRGCTKYRKLEAELGQMLESDLVAVQRTSRSEHEMMQSTTRWLDLPLEIRNSEILSRVLQSTTRWFDLPLEIRCSEILSRVIYVDKKLLRDPPTDYGALKIRARRMCMNAVDRSQGKLVDITMVGFCDSDLLEYVADRSPKLSRLEIKDPDSSVRSLSRALEKLPNLEELSIHSAFLQVDQALGNCKNLKTLRLNRCGNIGDEEIIAISKKLKELRHLEMRMNYSLSNTGLQAILDGCPCLKVLDLRLCPNIDLKGDIEKRLEQIECVLHTEY